MNFSSGERYATSPALRPVVMMQTLLQSGPRLAVRDWSLLRWLILPAFLLALLTSYPPHGLDMAVSRLFYHHGWFSATHAGFFTTVYLATKAIPVLVALYLLWAVWTLKDTPTDADTAHLKRLIRGRLFYVIGAMIVCGLTVDWLKMTSGVYCPWSITAFGGEHAVTDPILGLSRLPGRCWPSGHAGTGFCLFALYFALRDFSAVWARRALMAALAVGVMAAMTRLLQGAHFLSHNVATLLVDWLICAILYTVIFDRRRLGAKIRGLFSRDVHLVMPILLTALWWTAVFDRPFFQAVSDAAGDGSTFFVLSLASGFFFIALAFLSLLAWLLPRPAFRGVLILLAFCGASAYVGKSFYGVVFTPDMARNYLATDWREASEYFSPQIVVSFLTLSLPAVAFAWVKGGRVSARWEAALCRPGILRRLLTRTGVTLGCLLTGLALMLLNLQTFSSTMRAHRQLRYEIAPFNIPYSFVATLVKDSNPDVKKDPVIIDPAPVLAQPEKPRFLVVLVGETTRDANWQLSGYARETTPRLAAEKGVINFSRVVACGSSTDVSLPCMMSRIGRSDYDRDRILAEESVLNLIQRAGADVAWIDNQSGCKGVCQGVPTSRPAVTAEDCPDGRCFDTALVTSLREKLRTADPHRTTVLFLHMYGSHGPSYYKASSEDKKAFKPECRSADFGKCTDEEIRNAYDNSVRETDSVLADSIAALREAEKTRGLATGLIWVSDHGESLGEKNLYLHGAPYMMAPDEQIEVPMVMWFSDTFTREHEEAVKAVRAKLGGEVTHEHLFSTLLGLLDIQSKAYRRDFDLSAVN